ncbi:MULTISPECIES: PilW family protein [unclassified Acidovorax]|uniref:PilW family protein n=1 Tax=unclassified Acidovorax TaxID=2684926 RepID=UPI0009E80126|nr:MULTISPECIES: PilW family protein [unclassified Acidovorax]PUA95941.1 type IV pilus assembly protein PilW [Acidovorax sp. 107]
MKYSARITQQGLTLVELMVSLVLASLITLAAVGLYTVGISSYRTVDAGQELQDNGRFALEVIGQAARQAGYENYPEGYGLRWTDTYATNTSLFPSVRGANNAKVASVTSVNDDGTNDNGGYNSSDTLAFRFHGASLQSDRTKADGSMIDCQGVAQTAPLLPNDMSDVAVSLFWVKVDSTGEPSLQCISRGDPASPSRNTQPIIKGVESFQVMYGLDVNANSVPEKWVSANDVTNWTQVSAVRVGFVLRGPPGSSQGYQGASATANENKLYPLGATFTGSSTEAALIFTPPADGRLRRTFNATFTLRNPQN